MNDQGHTVIEHVELERNRELLAAVIVSMVTSIVLALVGIVLTIYSLSYAFKLFALDSSQIRVYAI